MIDRRRFLQGAAGSLTAGWLSQSAYASPLSESAIEIWLSETQGTISPDLYGYLLENIGSAIYDGVWVGTNSRIANIGGIRRELIERLREIKASVIRWPGGNFADYYDWHDGIGARGGRPRRTNPWSDETPREAPAGPQRYDPNEFGTHEFGALCNLTGGRPFLNLNVRAMSPMDAAQWVDYCNAPEGSTTLADLRKKNGSAAPFGVDYWGIGNEPWSWGGNMSAKDYAGFYRRFVEGLPRHGRELRLIACGGPPTLTHTEWTRTFLEECKHAWRAVPIFAMSVHYYSSFPLNGMFPGETVEGFRSTRDDRPRPLIDPLSYDEGGWYSLLSDTLRIEGLIEANWEAVREFDPGGRIKLVVDEWGGIFKFSDDLGSAAIHTRGVALRDALSAGLTLNVLQRHADKIAEASFTGLVNQEGGLFRARGGEFVATPVYYVFQMYANHQGGQAVRTDVSAPQIVAKHQDRIVSIAGLSGSASISGRTLTLTVVNPHVSESREASIVLRGGAAEDGQVTTLTHTDIHAQNTFDDPGRVKPVSVLLEAQGSSFRYRFAPASVSSLTVSLRRT